MGRSLNISAVLEERAAFIKERKNGLYGPTPFVLSNSLINIPFLFACAVFFVVIMYWGIVNQVDDALAGPAEH
jgi:ABC-type multidrug transport system permease subunit